MRSLQPVHRVARAKLTGLDNESKQASNQTEEHSRIVKPAQIWGHFGYGKASYWQESGSTRRLRAPSGKHADLVVIAGDPSTNTADIEKVETVFKNGVAYDPAKLVESVRGLVGLR
jgi:hypothetical protein